MKEKRKCKKEKQKSKKKTAITTGRKTGGEVYVISEI